MFYHLHTYICLYQGRGTVATGRVEQGTIKVGEDVEILGLMQVTSESCTHVPSLILHIHDLRLLSFPHFCIDHYM